MTAATENGRSEQEAPLRRYIEPFVYFRGHASAIPGLGGQSRSPNPNYCFHTHYFEYQPGAVKFRIRIADAHASCGELEVRIHGYRPDNPDLGIKHVTGERLALADLSGDTVELAVRIAAIPGVHYAVFGHYTEPGDLRATSVDILVEEHGGEDAQDYNDGLAPETTLALEAPEAASSLVTYRSASLAMPGSQACTYEQLSSAEFLNEWPQFPLGEGETEAMVARWREIFVLQVLKRFGFLTSGASGVALGGMSVNLEAVLHAHGCLMAAPQDVGGDMTDASIKGYFDFLLCFDSGAACRRREDLPIFIAAALRHLLGGGIAIFLLELDARPPVHDAEDGQPPERSTFTRADIERQALRLIGHGFSVAQLHFPSGLGGDRAVGAPVAYGLVVRR